MSVKDLLRPYHRSYELWARTFYRIKDKHGVVVPLALRPMQRAIGEAERRELEAKGKARIYILKGRQGGITTDQQARSLHTIWRWPGAECITLAHTDKDTEKIFGITERAIQQWPDRWTALMPDLGDKTAREVSFPGLDSVLFTGTAGSKRVGRGLTLYRLHGSEFAFWDDPETVLGAMMPALERPGTTAVLETTAAGYGSVGHLFWQEAAARGWLPLFFPWWECDPELYRDALEPEEADAIIASLDEEERQLHDRYGLDAEQLAWRRRKMREMGRDTFLQEYAEDEESCWLAPGGMFYDAGQLKALMLRAPEPRERLLNGAVSLYGEANGERVIIGADTAEGVNKDRTTFVARAWPSWRLLASYEDRTIDPVAFAVLLDEWGRRFADATGPAFLVVEKNTHGITVLRQLRDAHHYPISKIYHRVAQDKDVKERQDRIGWHTGAETKPLMLDSGRMLFLAALEGQCDVPSKAALRDAFAVRRDPDTGKVDTNGRDMLVAECLAWIGRGSIITVPRTSPTRFAS